MKLGLIYQIIEPRRYIYDNTVNKLVNDNFSYVRISQSNHRWVRTCSYRWWKMSQRSI